MDGAGRVIEFVVSTVGHVESIFRSEKGVRLNKVVYHEEKVVSLLEHVREGCGVRQTARLVHVNQNTVMRDSRLSGSHATLVHDELVAFSPSDAGSTI